MARVSAPPALDPRGKSEDDGIEGCGATVKASRRRGREAIVAMSKTGKAILVRFWSAAR